ncbi:MAG: 30S ribosomal protein S20 [Patescibacteria group bacterium]|nr:30S ribosomal protein S20 [Patescibacteria group bacterium]
MPRIKSAKKALRQNIRRYNRNIERQKKLKGVIKEYKKTLAAGNKEEIKKQLSLVYKTLDKMAKVDLIKPGKANRLKSRLSKKIASTS